MKIKFGFVIDLQLASLCFCHASEEATANFTSCNVTCSSYPNEIQCNAEVSEQFAITSEVPCVPTTTFSLPQISANLISIRTITASCGRGVGSNTLLEVTYDIRYPQDTLDKSFGLTTASQSLSLSYTYHSPGEYCFLWK